MANLRIIYNNVADTATIEASDTVAGTSTDNLKNTKKTSVHRSITVGTSYTLTWGSDQVIGGLALPATNLVEGSTIRVIAYDRVNGVLYDSQTIQAARDKQIPTGITSYTSSTFPYSGATKTSVWFPQIFTTVRKILVVIFNSAAVGFVECSRIVCGTYWEGTRQASNGISLGINDNSIVTFTRSGDSYVDKRPLTETMNFQLQYLTDTDRKTLLSIMRTYGTTGLLYVSVFPDNANTELVQTYTVYGRSQNNSIEYALFNLYNTTLTINSW